MKRREPPALPPHQPPIAVADEPEGGSNEGGRSHRSGNGSIIWVSGATGLVTVEQILAQLRVFTFLRGLIPTWVLSVFWVAEALVLVLPQLERLRSYIFTLPTHISRERRETFIEASKLEVARIQAEEKRQRAEVKRIKRENAVLKARIKNMELKRKLRKSQDEDNSSGAPSA